MIVRLLWDTRGCRANHSWECRHETRGQLSLRASLCVLDSYLFIIQTQQLSMLPSWGDKFKYELLGIQLEVKHVSIWKLECANLTNRSSFTHTQVTHRNHRLSTYMYLRAFFRQRDLFRVFCYHGCQKVNHLHVHLQHFHQILVVHLWNACKYLR